MSSWEGITIDEPNAIDEGRNIAEVMLSLRMCMEKLNLKIHIARVIPLSWDSAEEGVAKACAAQLARRRRKILCIHTRLNNCFPTLVWTCHRSARKIRMLVHPSVILVPLEFE